MLYFGLSLFIVLFTLCRTQALLYNSRPYWWLSSLIVFYF